MIRSQATNRWRDNWHAEYEIKDDRAEGKLLTRNDSVTPEYVVREKFSVAIKDGKFNVDIGTGSGVKVTFKTP